MNNGDRAGLGLRAAARVADDPADDTTAYFDAFAADYQASVERSVGFTGRDLGFFHRRKVHVLRRLAGRHLGNLAGARVLDVGCGAGVTDELLQPYVGSLHGVDVSKQMVAQAKVRNPSAMYEPYDGEHLPFPDGSFDFVLTICVVHHVPPPRWSDFVQEMARVTRPGGLVAILEHNPLNPLTRRAVSTCEFDEDAVLVPHRRATRLLRDAGVGPVEVCNFLFSPFEGRVGSRIDQWLARVPFGGQYVAAGRRHLR